MLDLTNTPHNLSAMNSLVRRNGLALVDNFFDRALNRRPFDLLDLYTDIYTDNALGEPRRRRDLFARSANYLSSCLPSDSKDEHGNTVMEFNVAGFAKSELAVAVEDGSLLTVRGERVEGSKEAGESSSTLLAQRILPKGASVIGAAAENGILRVTVKGPAERKSRTVDIKVQ